MKSPTVVFAIIGLAATYGVLVVVFEELRLRKVAIRVLVFVILFAIFRKIIDLM